MSKKALAYIGVFSLLAAVGLVEADNHSTKSNTVASNSVATTNQCSGPVESDYSASLTQEADVVFVGCGGVL